MSASTISRWEPSRISAIAKDVRDISENSRDYIVPRSALSAIDTPEGIALQFTKPDGDIGTYVPSPHAIRQLGSSLRMSGNYISRLRDAGSAGHLALLALNLRTLLQLEPGKSHMVRTISNRARAVLSDSYKTVDNWSILKSALQAVSAAGGEVWNLRHDLDGGLFRFQAWNPEVREMMKERPNTIIRPGQDGGDPYLYPVISVGNSETGTGASDASIGTLDGFCSNTMLWSKEVARVHLGRKKDAGEYLASDETRQLEGQMVVSQISDLIKTAFSPNAFSELVRKINASKDLEIPSDVKMVKLVNATCKLHGISDDLAENMLESFLARGDRSAYGLGSAVNSLARPQAGIKLSDSQAVSLEETAGNIMRMNSRSWGSLLALASA